MKTSSLRTAGLALAVLVLIGLFAPCAEAQRRGGGRGNVRWAPDGVHLIVGGGQWVDPVTGDPVDAVETPATPTLDRMESVAALLKDAGGKPVPADVWNGTRETSTLPRQPIAHPGAKSTSDGKVQTVVVDGALWVAREGGKATKVAEGLAGVRHFMLAPNGGAVSYIDGYDLCICDLQSGTVTRLSKDGGENLFYGELDWVYSEEVYGRGEFDAAWWAPDGGHLAFLRIDESGVDTFTVVDHLEKTLGIELIKYPKSGTVNPRATLHVAAVAGGVTVPVDLSSYPASDEILIVDVSWTPEADRVVCAVQNREQTWLDLLFVDPKTGAVQRVIHEQCDDGWVNRLSMPRWLRDGSFLWESERTGYKHFYRYARDGKLLAAVSHGAWDAGTVLGLDEDAGWIVFTGKAEGYAIGNHAYRATLDGKELRQLTEGRGTHSIALNGDGSMYLDRVSSLANPGEEWLRSIDGKVVRQLGKVEPPDGAILPVWEQIDARDGVKLDVVYTLPTGFDPNKTYPVWIETYSGPDAPTIRDQFVGARGASDWFVLLQVNVRSASGAGMNSTKTCYRQFGVQELRDIEDAIDWLCKNPWADASRVGITGWSYGGFMTAFALTHSKKFKCGVAGAGVYDWELYDTIYTERYMAKPQNNAAGYAASSVVKAARNLHGELLIVHGTMDDNVHMQNAIQFLDALQKAGKQNFSFMLYPNSRHGVRSAHLPALVERFRREHL